MNGYSLIPRGAENLPGNVLTPPEEAAIRQKLWQLLTGRIALYTAGDNSSLRVETGEELMNSLCFLLRLCLEEEGKCLRDLVTEEPTALLARALALAQKKVAHGKRLYQTACLSVPATANRALTDTLRGIDRFFKVYDLHYFAHQIPGQLDYQLAVPVSDELQGIAYINDYLSRLILENHLVRQFPAETVTSLLAKNCPDYRDALLNLYEPVATCALGLALAGEPIFSLGLTELHQTALTDLLAPLSHNQRADLLRRAAQTVLAQTGSRNRSAKGYLTDTALALLPRIEAALTAGTVAGIFPAW
ncbi:MAG: DUF6179 domain-containing protein [Oscillospiraceae bacterium]